MYIILIYAPFPGTTVTAAHLFKTVPVRRQYYSSSTRKKEELKRVEDLLMCYGYINHGVRFALSHNKKLVWQKSIVASCKVALLNTVGSSVMNQMEYVEQHDGDTGVRIWKLCNLLAPFVRVCRCVVLVIK